ncbi:uncharacterized protein LOC114359515 [Ostrinia furnacalis]|uniref:uncharacterized protein LOC114359515 n=1 Tax=Ostrinia furnacalis TaxID=93504 RepID=UPI00103C3D49|nr:uncharacterized protein LOC114359515 [Ostrinia furnacalis]
MRLHAFFLFVLFVINARAATIHGPAVPELEKKLPIPEETNKDVIPAENASSEQELIDAANTVQDVENNLRVKAVDSIPVSVIVESDANPTDDNEVTPIVRRVVDLKNPGEPQRQEHETQNAVHYDDEQQIVTSVKQTVVDTQNALKQGFQGVTQGIQNWIANSEQLSAIQASIQNLQESFKEQISKLNETIQSFWQNRVGSNQSQAAGNDVPKPEIESVESQLKILEDNFQTGVKALSEGVQVFALLKAENENPTSPAPTAPNNLFVQYLQLFQQTISQGFNNVTHAFQNYVNQSPNNTASNPGLLQGLNNGIQNILNPQPAGTQSDDASTSRPSLWQGIQSSIQNILKPTQNQAAQGSNGTPNRPITQAIQNLPFVQGVVNLIQPNKPGAQQPAQAQPAKPADPVQPAAEGSNVVPVETKPESDVQPAKAPVVEEVKPEQPSNNNGPIQSIIQNNPIVKGISGAVQKLQASITNPEKPRETEKEPENEKGDVKGGFYPGYGYGGNAGDNNDKHISSDSGVALKAADGKLEEPAPEKPTAVVAEAQETDKTDQS